MAIVKIVHFNLFFMKPFTLIKDVDIVSTKKAHFNRRNEPF